jgi:hypothetical protein
VLAQVKRVFKSLKMPSTTKPPEKQEGENDMMPFSPSITLTV